MSARAVADRRDPAGTLDPAETAPAARPAPEAPSGPPPVLGPGARFRGLVSFRGSAAIAGAVEGDVVGRGRLVVTAGARIEGRVDVDEVRVDGRVEGPIRARTRIELGPNARVVGELTAPRIAVAEGARLDGRLACTPTPDAASLRRAPAGGSAEGPAPGSSPDRAARPEDPASTPESVADPS